MICKTCLIDKTEDKFRPGHYTCRKCNNIKNKNNRCKYLKSDKYKETLNKRLKEYKNTEAYKNNKKKHRAIKQQKDKETLHRNYIYKLLYNKGFRNSDITEDLIDVQRLIIKTKRLCKTLQN